MYSLFHIVLFFWSLSCSGRHLGIPIETKKLKSVMAMQGTLQPY